MHRAVLAFSLLVALAAGAALFAPEARATDLCRDAYLSCVSSSNQCRADFDAQATQCRREVRTKWNECEQWHRTNRPGVDPRAACIDLANQHEQCGARRATACPTANACLGAVEECQRSPRARTVKPTPAPGASPETIVEPARPPSQGRRPVALLISSAESSGLSLAQRMASWSPSR